jgi:hypothetical protein
MTQNFKMQDRLLITMKDDRGRIIDHRETFKPESLEHRIRRFLGLDQCLGNDLILDAGIADVADMILDRYDYISVGNGTTVPAHDDTELESEVLTRAAADKSQSSTFFTDDTIEFRGEFTPDINVAVSESGIHLTATPSGDICFARETFVPMQWYADVAVEVAWEIILMR